MEKNKKVLSVLSTAAVAGLIVAAVSTPASAQATAIDIKDKDAKLFEYQYQALKDSAKDAALDSTSTGAALYNDFIARKASLAGYYDSVTKGHVSMDTLSQALIAGTVTDAASFKTFMEDAKTPTTVMTPDAVTVGTDGKIVVTPFDNSKVVSSVSAITATTTAGTVATLPSTVQVTLGDGTTANAAITWSAAATSAATYATAGTVTVTGTLADYDNYAVSATVTVNAAQLAVSSVTPINGKTVQVKFNKPVDKTTVIGGTAAAPTLANITFTAVATTPTTPSITSGSAKAELSDDGTVLTVTPQTTEYFGGQYVVSVPTTVKDKDGNSITAYAAVHTLNDTTRPTISAPTYTANGTAHFVVSEPITVANVAALEAATTITKVADGTSIASTGLVTLSTDGKSIDVNTSSLVVGKDYKVTFMGLKDFAGNLIAQNPSTFTVQNTVLDEVNPEVKSIETTKEGQMKITFSEKLKDQGAGVIGAFKVDGGSAINIDTTTGTGNATVDSTGTVVTVTDAVNLTAGLKSIMVTGYKDLSGNTGADFSKVLNFVADTTAPTLVSSNVQKIDDVEYLVLTYSENVTPQDAVAINGKVVKDYVETTLSPAITTDAETASTPAQNFTLYNPDTNGKSASVKLDLSTLNAGDYTLNLPAGLVKDEATLSSDATKVTFTRTSNSNKPKLTTAGTNGITKVDNNTYTVTFDRQLDPTTALDVNNYAIEGVTVQSAIFTQNNASGAVVKLTLADGSVSISGDREVTVKNVKSAAGTAMDTVTTTETFTENVKPTIKSAVLTGTDTITVTFSEAMDASTIAEGTAAADFDICVGGVNVAEAASSPEAAVVGDTTGTKFTIKLNTALTANDLTKDVVIKPASGIDAADANGNVLTFTSTTVTK